MDWREALDEIESVEFDVWLNVVSSFSLYMKGVRKQPAVTALYRAMQESEEALETVLDRVCQLSRREIDTRYANMNDTPLSVYLWLLSLCRRTYATVGALCVAGAPNCHYAWKVTRTILLPALAPVPGGDIAPERKGDAEEMPENGCGGWAFIPCPLSNSAGKVLAGDAMMTNAAGGPGLA